MKLADTTHRVSGQPVYGRRPLLILWAICIGLVLRNVSPYRYQEAGHAYPWVPVLGTVLLLTLEAATLYLLLTRWARGSPASNLARATGVCFLFFIATMPWYRIDPPTPWWALSASLGIAGVLVLGVYAALLALRGSRRRRHHAA